MKIAFLAPRYHTNQTALVKYLLKNKHQVFFYVTRIGQSEDHSLLKPILINFNNFFKVFKRLIKYSNPSLDYRYGIPSIRELIKFKSNKCDLIIIRDPLNLMSLTYFLWAKLTGVKVILYIQRNVHNKSIKIKDSIYWIFITLFNTKCISPCLGNNKFNKLHKKIDYLPFCLNINNYSKVWFLNNKINILTVGKFVSRKNHLLLIRALSKIKTKYDFQLTIIGECTTQEHLNYLKKIKKQINVNNYDIKILTNIKSKDVSNMYKKNDLFVLPSVNEPASVSNLEAMAYGLPVITTDTNNTSCYTEDEINGYIVKSNDIESLAKKIEYLIENKDLLIKFGNKSINLVKEKYNPDVNYKKYFQHVLNY